MLRPTPALAVLLAAAVLAACERRADETPDPAPPPPAAEAPAATPAPTAGPPPLPPISAQRYVGRWAATPALCLNGAWIFQPMSLSTAGDTSCRFDNVTESFGGYDIVGSCLQDGATKSTRMRLTFAEASRSMVVEGVSFQPTGLIRCGPETTPEAP